MTGNDPGAIVLHCTPIGTVTMVSSVYSLSLSLCVCVQEPDLRYLVENIWASQSALSACSDLEELVLVRWDEHKAWSPWNCVLLTKDEGQAHSKLENALEVWIAISCESPKLYNGYTMDLAIYYMLLQRLSEV